MFVAKFFIKQRGIDTFTIIMIGYILKLRKLLSQPVCTAQHKHGTNTAQHKHGTNLVDEF